MIREGKMSWVPAANVTARCVDGEIPRNATEVCEWFVDQLYDASLPSSVPSSMSQTPVHPGDRS